MKKSLTFSLLLTILACSSGSENVSDSKAQEMPHQSEALEWLVGEWKMTNSNYTESWKWENDSVLAGRAFSIEEGDTIFHEKIRLYKSGEDYVYEPSFIRSDTTVSTAFIKTSAGFDTLIFENPQNDFPQIIFYERAGSDSLHVYIEGTGNDGAQSRRYFNMKRFRDGGE